jgi:hypothetical protein
MGVDQARKHGFLAEIDHTGAVGNFDLGRRSNLSDTIVKDKHHLIEQHLGGLAIE